MTPKTLLIYKHQKELEEARETELTDVSAWMIGAYISKASSDYCRKIPIKECRGRK